MPFYGRPSPICTAPAYPSIDAPQEDYDSPDDEY